MKKTSLDFAKNNLWGEENFPQLITTALILIKIRIILSSKKFPHALYPENTHSSLQWD